MRGSIPFNRVPHGAHRCSRISARFLFSLPRVPGFECFAFVIAAECCVVKDRATKALVTAFEALYSLDRHGALRLGDINLLPD